MKKIIKKHIIKIPNDINLIYIHKKGIITFISPICKKCLKLKTQIFFSSQKKTIIITQIPFIDIPNNKRKKLKSLQGINSALIKQCLIEISILLYQKLKFIGVGYRVFSVNNFNNKLLLFKLGYSHFLYFKLLKNFKYFNLKMTKLFIFGHSYQNITQIASVIRSYKKPEPYKGKGILYDTEKIMLKKGKAV